MHTIEELELAIEELELAISNSGITAGDMISFEFQDMGEPREVTGKFSETIKQTGFTGIMLGENHFCGVGGIQVGSLKKI